MAPPQSFLIRIAAEFLSMPQPFQSGVPVVFVTDEREISPDSLRSDKLLEQRRGKLNILPGGATSHHLPDRPAIVIQILIGSDAEMKFVPVHGITVG